MLLPCAPPSQDVSLLHLATGSMLGKIHAGDDEVEDQFSSFDVDPSERFLATVSRKSALVKIWDIKEEREMTSWKCAHQLPVLDLAYSPTGMELATCSADKSIVVYSVGRGGVVTHRFAPSASNPKQKPGHKSRVVHLFWHPNPRRAEIVSCAEDGEMRVWKLSDGSSTLLANHMGLVTSVLFTRDGDTLISGGRDKVVNVWSLKQDASYGAHQSTLPLYESIEGLALLSQRPSIVPASDKNKDSDVYFTSAGSKGCLRSWNLRTLDCVASKDLPTLLQVDDPSAQSKANAEKYIANQVAHLLRIPAKKATTTSSSNNNAKGKGASQVVAVAASPATEERLIAVTQEQNFYIYSARSFQRQNLLLGFNDEIIDLKAHPDNRHVFMASNSSQIRCLNLENLQADLISGHMDTVLALDISPCGKYIVSASKDTTVRFWSLDNMASVAASSSSSGSSSALNPDESVARCVAIGEGHTESVGCVTFNRNKHTGKLFAVSGARERIIKLWNCTPFFKAHSGEALAAAALAANANKSSASASSSPSTALKLTASASRIAHEKDINCLECSPNDKLVASGSEDKSIRIWSSEDLSPKAVLKGHRRGVWCIRFSPVDKVLASASGDKTIKLWSMEDFTCLKTFEGHSASVKQVLFINAGMQVSG